ncbi:double-strand break repair helicase AddA [uncultured Sphingomonas sp.]|uniref:double-strand break repair helicase AddA n=1 Tax=uncultured Sphingomonas sp. TaxID=158754 RepID=UPI0035C98CD6
MAVSGADRALPPMVDAQARASDPRTHVWLAASAGTGKTQVLAARVYRLLLAGVDPGSILCLTFTKAGANEMAARISSRLAAWVRMPDDHLGKDLIALGEMPSPELRIRARTLFARVLDAPGAGLRLQTIHGFCQSLLTAFPVEAGLTPGFRPLEAREEAALARDALARMLVDAEREGRTAPTRAVGALSLRLGEGGADAFLAACARAPDALAQMPAGEGVRPWVRRALDLPAGDIRETIAAHCIDDAIDAALGRIAATNRAWGTATGGEHADIAERWLSADVDARPALIEALVGLARTAKGEPRKASARLLAIDPDHGELVARIGERCADLLALQARGAYADLLADGLIVGRDYAAAYRAAKQRIGAVDFDDLIRATIDLLRQPGMGDWVRFKLDQATDHVLIDEAQDTNARQWAIVRAVTEEFFAGEGVRGQRIRTLFTVGDHKQAIFGFQGTDPIFFAAAEQDFGGRARAAAGPDGSEAPPFARLSLTASFRSTRPILEFVDAAVAALPPPGLGDIDTIEPHASRVEGPGRVTLWQPTTVAAEDDEGEEGWIADAVRSHATRIARQVRDWLDPANPLMLDSQGRALRPEDIMILVKRRGELASLIVARLHAENVPVAGVDRLRLTAPLGVQDLLAAVRFVLQPNDDLSLAGLLVSPLLGWSQDDLMAVASARRRGSLWAQLNATPDPRLAPLDAMLRRADFATPYTFLEELLTGPLDGRRKLIRRLGREVRDPIDELLNAALDFTRVATPSLQGFLDWFDRGEVEIVRDPSQPLDAVRVMTAHGAKGLQAPLVLLADATADPEMRPRSTMDWVPEPGLTLPIFRPTRAERSGPLAEAVTLADRRELAEHWRLFYVAATRAEERLEIAGALGPRAKGEAPANSWYALADAALAGLGADGEGAVRRSFAGTHAERPVRAARHAAASGAAPAALPDWARRPAPVEARPPRPLAPSQLGDDDVADPPPTPAMRAAAERGRLIHALFERLPAIAAAGRGAAADRWLERVGGVTDAANRAEMIATVLAVIDDPAHADLFGPESLGEAPISAVIAGGQVVAGTVDRLVVAPDRVLVVDFKTGRSVPQSADAIPAFHLRQMAAYAAALGAIFPGRSIAAALLYTAGPRLFVLGADLLAAHKPHFADAQQS